VSRYPPVFVEVVLSLHALWEALWLLSLFPCLHRHSAHCLCGLPLDLCCVIGVVACVWVEQCDSLWLMCRWHGCVEL
jgi:hypothetical protein